MKFNLKTIMDQKGNQGSLAKLMFIIECYFSCRFLRASIVSEKFPVKEMRYFQVKNMKMWYQQPKFN